jgi:cytochrome b561
MNAGYTLLQVLLHWLVAALVLVQYLTGSSIERTHHAVHLGLAPDPFDLLEHGMHNWSGIAVGGLMAMRLSLRWRQDGFSFRVSSGDLREHAARALHLGFYAALIGQAALGFTASYLTFAVAPLHVLGSKVILAMLGLHIAAAALHAARRDGVVARMMIGGPRAAR